MGIHCSFYGKFCRVYLNIFDFNYQQEFDIPTGGKMNVEVRMN